MAYKYNVYCIIIAGIPHTVYNIILTHLLSPSPARDWQKKWWWARWSHQCLLCGLPRSTRYPPYPRLLQNQGETSDDEPPSCQRSLWSTVCRWLSEVRVVGVVECHRTLGRGEKRERRRGKGEGRKRRESVCLVGGGSEGKRGKWRKRVCVCGGGGELEERHIINNGIKRPSKFSLAYKQQHFHPGSWCTSCWAVPAAASWLVASFWEPSVEDLCSPFSQPVRNPHSPGHPGKLNKKNMFILNCKIFGLS